MDVIGAAALLGARNEDPYLQGLEYLAGWENPAGSAAVASSAIVSFPPRDGIVILGRCVWGATADYLNMRVGVTPTTVDSGANYWDRNVISRGADQPGGLGPDGGVFWGSHDVSATAWTLQFVTTAVATDNGTTDSRGWLVSFANAPGLPHTAGWLMARSTGTAATTGGVLSGWGEYVNPSQQIVSVQIMTRGGTAQLAGDSGFGVFGRNYV